MSAFLGTYDPNKQLWSFCGVPLTGFAPDTFVEVERDEDGYMKQTGAGGEVTRTRNNNKGGSVTVTLLAGSPSNDYLSAKAAQDELTGTGSGALFGKELNGTTVAAAATAWVKKLPKVERGHEAGTVQWVFDCADLELFVGGLLG